MIPRADIRRIQRTIRRNWLLKIFSVVFAVGLWAFVNLGAREAEQTLLVPIELRNLPPTLVITNPVADSVDVRIRGPRTILGSIDERRQRVVLDLASAQVGTTAFKIDSEMLSLPRGVSVVRVHPVQVTISVDRIVRKSLPVVPDVAGALPAGYRIVDTDIRPSTVLVTGPANQVETLEKIRTEPLNVPAASAFDESVALERLGELVQLQPERVVVRGRVEEIKVSQDFKQVEIGVRNAGTRYLVQPRRADVIVRGPRRLLQGLKLSQENVFVDVAGLAPGAHREKIEVTLPEGIEALELRPSEVSIRVLGAPRARKKG